MNILVVEDEKTLNKQLTSVLKQEHYNVDSCTDGNTALELILDRKFDLIILDIMLPELDGYEILKQIRDSGITTPVLIISAKNEIDDRIKGLNLGADDYLNKPFSLAELIARVKAILRRTFSQYDPVIKINNLVIDTDSRKILMNDKFVNLTLKEYELLEYLALNKDRVVSKLTIAEHIWGENFDLFSMSNFIDVHIKNIRKKIGDEKHEIIQTVRGIGYILKDTNER